MDNIRASNPKNYNNSQSITSLKVYMVGIIRTNPLNQLLLQSKKPTLETFVKLAEASDMK
jgi:hypothetical protein